jgi:hypothetical protein
LNFILKTFLIKSIKISAILFVVGFVFFGNADSASAATYYGKTGVSPHLTTSWGTTAGVCTGAGSQPANFTTNGDIFIIESCATMTASAVWTVGSAAATTGTGKLQINSGGTLAMSTFLLTLASTSFENSGTYSGSGGVTISGTGTTISIGGFTTTGTVSMTKTAGTATFTAAGSTTGNVNGAGLTINGSGGTLNLGTSLTHTFTAAVTLTAGTLNGGSSTLNANGATTTCWTGTGTVFSAGTGTVNFGRAGAQTIAASTTTFNNLTVSGSGAKTFSNGNTVNGIYSIENSTTANVYTGVITYGASAGLQYNAGSSARSAIVGEWPATFTGTGGVTIKGTGAISLAASTPKVFNAGVTLNINTNAIFSPGTNSLTFNGNFVNTGTMTSAATPIVITGTATQSIGTINSTGACSMTKASGTATLTGNMTCGAFTKNGAAGTLDISTYTLTISGATTNTAGTLIFTSGTVNYSGAAQTAFPQTYNNLTLSGSAAKTLTGITTVNGNFAMSGSASTTTGALTTVGGNWTQSGTSAYTMAATTNLTVTGNFTVGDGASAATFTSASTDTLTVNGIPTIAALSTYSHASSGTIAFGNASNDDFVINGTLSNTAAGTGKITATGSVTGTGTVTLTGATTQTFEQRVLANENFFTTSGSTNWAFKTLTFSNGLAYTAPVAISTQTGGSGNITVQTTLVVGGNSDNDVTYLDPGDVTWTLSGTTGTPLSIIGYLCPNGGSCNGVASANTSTILFTGEYTGGTTTIPSSDAYYNVSITPTITAARAYTIVGSTVANNLTIQPTKATSAACLTATLSSGNLTVGGALTLTGTTFGCSILDTSGFGYAVTAGTISVPDGPGASAQNKIIANSSLITVTGLAFTMGSTSTLSAYTAGTSTIKFINSANSLLVFTGGGKTYNNVWFSRGASIGTIEIVNGNTFADFKDDGSAAHSILFHTGLTQTMTSWTVSGSVGNLITINTGSGAGTGTTATTTHTLSDASGVISSDYLDIQHSVATGGASWYAGANSINDNGVATAGSGWIFTPPAYNITISTGTTTCTGSPNFVTTNSNCVVKNTDINALIYAHQTTSFTASGDITISSVVSKGFNDAPSSTLNFYANRNIIINSQFFTDDGPLNLLFNSDRDANGDGYIYVASTVGQIYTGGGYIKMGGGSGTISAGVGYARGNATQVEGVKIDTSNLFSDSSNIIINGQGYNTTTNSNYGVYILNGGSVFTNSGSIDIYGTGAGNTNSTNDIGVRLESSSEIQSQSSGTINIVGVGGANTTGGTDSNGVYIYNSLIDTVSGNITITGTGGNPTSTAANGSNMGVVCNHTTNCVQSTGTGDITIVGTGGNDSGSGTNNWGIYVVGKIVGGGNGSDITLTGTGGNGSGGLATGLRIDGANGRVTNTGSGAITLNGTGEGTGNSANGFGVTVTGGAIVSSVNGLITVNGTGGGAGTGTSNYGVYITGTSSAIKTTGTGNLVVNGVRGGGDTASNYGLNIAFISSNGLQTTGSGTITINTDTISLDAANNINSVGALTIAPYNAATTVGVNGGAGTLGLTTTFLSYMTSASLQIGNTAQTGTTTAAVYASWAKPITFSHNASGSIAISGAQTNSSSFTFDGPATLSAALNASALTITANGNLTAGAQTITLSGSGTPFVNNGIFTYGTSTVNYTNAGSITMAAMDGSGGTNGYYNLDRKPTITGAVSDTATPGDIIVNNNFTIQPTKATSAACLTETLGGNLTVIGALTLTGTTFGCSILDTSVTSYDVTAGTISVPNGPGANAQNKIIANDSLITVTGLAFTMGTTSTLSAFTAGNSTLKFTNSTNSLLVFNGGGKTYGYVLFDRGASTGIIEIVSGNTFDSIEDNGSAAHTYLFNAGVTQTFTSSFNISGLAGNLVTINSGSGAGTGTTSTAVHTLSKASGIVISDYLNIQHSVATGGAAWYAGANSTNNNGVSVAGSGWIFTGATNRYWVGGGGDAFWTTAGNWAYSSGGAGGAAVPTSADDVFFNAASSAASTLSANITIKSLDMTGYVGTLTHNAGVTLTVAGDTYKLASGMTYTLGDVGTSATSFTDPNDGMTKQITTNGKILGNVTFGGTATSYVFNDSINANSFSLLGTLTLKTNSTLTINSLSTTSDFSTSRPILKDSGSDSTLTIKSGKSIIINNNVSSTLNKLNLIIQADSGGNGSGYIAVQPSAGAITTNGGNITMGGGSGTISAGSGYAVGNSGQAAGVYINGRDVNAGGGNIIVNGQGYNTSTNNNHGVQVTGASGRLQTTGSGTITVSGLGKGITDSASNYGVYVDSGGQIITVDGLLTINNTTGGGAGTGFGNYGLYITGTGSTVKTTGTGSISITVTGGNVSGSAAQNYGVYCTVANCIQTTGTPTPGNITINGTGGGGAGTGSTGVTIDISGSITGASNSNISITGIGSTTGSTAARGIRVLSGGAVSTLGSGTITLDGTCGGTSSATNVAVRIDASPTAVSTVNGNITVNATCPTAGGLYIATGTGLKTTGSGNITVNASSSTSYSGVDIRIANGIQTTGSGTITINTDTINLTEANDINSVGALTIAPYNAATTMGVAGGAGTLQLTSTYLTSGYIAWGAVYALTLGTTSTTGTIDVGAYASWAKPVTFAHNSTGSVTISGAQTNSSYFSTTGPVTLSADITAASLFINSGIFNAGSSTITLTGTNNVFINGGGTFTAGTSLIKVTDSSGALTRFIGGSGTYNNIWFDRGGTTGITLIGGNNTFNDFKLTGTIAQTLLFTEGTTTTVSSWNVTGSSGKLITINSADADQSGATTTNTHTLSDASGTNISDYLSVQHSVATGGAAWYAGANSTNNQGVSVAGSGWIFTGATNRYWVGGGGDAFWTTAGNWAYSSGGAGGAAVPNSTNDVFFNASGNTPSTLSANITINSLDMTGYTNTLTHNAATTLTIAGDTYKLASGMTYTLGNAATSATAFQGVYGIDKQITTASKVLGNVVFIGEQDAFFTLNDDLFANTITSSGVYGISWNVNNTSTISSLSTSSDLSQYDFDVSIAKMSGNDSTLTIKSGRNIIGMGVASFSNKLHLVLQADSFGNGSGYISVGGVTTNGGNITIGGGSGTISAGSGYAVGNSGQAVGVLINNVNVNAGGGNIIVNGQGYNTSTNNNHGVQVTGASGRLQTSGSGTITVSGLGKGTTNSASNYGVYVDSGGQIITANGLLTINNTTGGGAGSGTANYGLYITGASSTVKTTGTGNISITATGGNASGTGGSNYGVYCAVATCIQTTGGTPGTITVNGTGGNGSGSGAGNYGVLISGSGAGIVSATGSNISVTGIGGASSGNTNYGVAINGAGAETSFISTNNNGTITIIGTGGGSVNSASSYGVNVSGSGAASQGYISTANGLITITGTGGGAGSGTNNYGVNVSGTTGGSGTIKTTGSGNIIVNGIRGGGDTATNYGLNIGIANGIQTTSSGTITVNTDTINLNASNNINSVGALTIAPYNNATTTGVAGGSGTLQLSSTFLGYLTSTSLQIGTTSTTGTIDVGAYASWAKPITFAHNASGSTTISGAQTNSSTFTFNGPATLSADITSSTLTISSGTFTPGAQTITLTGTGEFTGSGTFTAGTSLIKFTNTSGTAITFRGNGGTYNNVWFDRGAATGNIIIFGANTFNDFKDTNTVAHTIFFQRSITHTFNTFTVSGSAGNLISIDSITNLGDATTLTHTLSKASGTVVSDYLNIQHSVATGGAVWYAGANSTNNNGVATAGSGWIFTGVVNRYWVGGGADAFWTTAGNWSYSSGGAGGASVPNSTNDVFFNAASSASSTLSANITIKSLDMTGYVGTLTHNAGTALTIAGNTYTLASGMTYTLGHETSSQTYFSSTTGTSGSPTQITTNGKTLGGIAFTGSGGYFQLNDNFTAGSVNQTTGTILVNTTSTMSSVATYGSISLSTVTKNSGADSVFTIKSTGTIATLQPISSSSNKLGLILQADSDANSSGLISIGGSITTNGGNITMGGGSGTISAGSGYAVGNGATIDEGIPVGVTINNVNVNAGGGNIIVNGQGYNDFNTGNHGVRVTGASGKLQTSGSGTITVSGLGKGTTNSASNYGVYVDTGGQIITVDGLLTINNTTGGGAGSGTSNYGLYIVGTNSTVKTTGTGSISITATGGNASGTGGSNYGVYCAVATCIQTTGGTPGTITVNGTGGNGSGSGTNNYGVYVVTPGSIIGASGSNVSVTGIGGNSSGNTNHGIYSTGTITAAGTGTLTLVGTGGGNTNSGSNAGVFSDFPGTITSANGLLTVTGTGGGAGSGINNYGVHIKGPVVSTGDNVLIQTTGSGNIIVNGIRGGGDTATNYGLIQTGVDRGIYTSGSGTITVNTDTISLAAGSIYTINSVGALTIAPYNAATTVGVAGGAGTLQLTSTYLGYLTSTSLQIGTTSTTGTIDVGAYASWAKPITFAHSTTGSINVTGAQTNSSTFTFNGTTALSADITSSNLTVTGSASDFNAGAQSITLTGTGTVFSLQNGGMATFTGATSLVKVTNTSNTDIIFQGGDSIFNNVWFDRGASTGSISINNGNTFNDFKDTGTVAHSILFHAVQTQTFTTFTVSGSAGNLITINSGNGIGGTSTSTHTLSDASGTNISDYLNIQHSVATGGAAWYAGANSTNNNSVSTAGSGWIFTAAACISQSSGTWNTAGRWLCGHVPTTGDATTISAGHTITMDVASAVLGAITIDGSLNTSNGTSWNLSGTTLNITSTGALTANNSTITLSGTSGTLFTKHASGTFTAGGSTVTLSGNGNTTVNSGTVTFNNLTSYNNSGGIRTLGGDVVVGGNFAQQGGTFQLSTYNFTVSGTTTITVGNGGNVVLDDNSSTGTNLFVGSVLVDSDGLDSVSWTSTGNSAYTFRGGFTRGNIANTFVTSGSGVYTFDTNAQTISGGQAFSITNITNNITTGNGLTFSGAQPTVTTLTQGTNAVLTFSGTVPTITTLTATASGNTVQYTSGSAQTIKGTTYHNLTKSGAGVATLGGATIANGTLTLTSGTLDAGNYNVTAGNFSSSNANTRAVTMGSGTWTLTGTGTVWDTTTTTGLTVTPNTSTIKITDSSSSTKTFAGGGKTYNNIWFAPTTDMTGLGQASRYWFQTSVDSFNHNVYSVDSDTGDIYKQTAGSGSFSALSAGNRVWIGISVDSSNQNVYASAYGGDIYKQTAGTGSFSALGQTSRNWYGLAVDSSNQNVYAIEIGGDIYKQTGGAGNFVALGETARSWRGIAVDSVTHDVYATVSSGDIYKQTGGAGSFVALGQTARSWRGISADSVTHNVYAVVQTGDIYKQTAGTGDFVAMNQTTRDWVGISVDSSNQNVYASTYGGDIYKQTAGTGSFTISGDNTFNDFKDTGTAGHSILFTAGSTQTVSTWNVNGAVGNLITINSTTTGTHTLSKASGTVISDYLNIQHSVAGGGATWYAGANSIDNNGVTTAGSGWIFSAPPCTSNGTGSWNTVGTWACGRVPTTSDIVTITSNHTITMDVASAALGVININGSLTTSNSNYALSASKINIASTGTLTANGSTITLNGTTGTIFSKDASGTFTAGASTLKFTGDPANGSVTLTNNAPITFNNLELSPALTGSGTYNFGTSALTIDGNFDIKPTGATGGTDLIVNLGANTTVAATKTTTIAPDPTNAPTAKLDVGTSNLTTGKINIASGGTFDVRDSTLTLTGTGGAGGSSSAGPSSPGTLAQDTTVGSANWGTSSNAGSSDNTYANVQFCSPTVKENSVKLIKGGTISGDDKSTNATLPTSDTYVSYGGASDMWGLSLVPSDINASNFGVGFSAKDSPLIVTSYYLKATNFGFSIPSDATITGVKVEIEEKYVGGVCGPG